jgi:hypothetical protein
MMEKNNLAKLGDILDSYGVDLRAKFDEELPIINNDGSIKKMNK